MHDLRNLIDRTDLGVRIEIAESGDRLQFRNELSGGAMAIGEVAGGQTATELGVRSLSGNTRLADFNDGRGVAILSGGVDPVTGAPDPSRDLDFKVTLGDGRSFDVDLAGSETVTQVLSRINEAATASGLTVPDDFNAGLRSFGNGLLLTDGDPISGSITVTALNNSSAAERAK